jgi:ABC-type protease/lipase transport system fused ATPase/permease subunit
MKGILGTDRWLWLAAAAFSLVINVALLAPSLYMLQVFDRVLATRSIETLGLLSLIAGVALALMFVLDVVRARQRAGGLVGSATRCFRQSVQVAMMGAAAWLVIEQRATPGVMIAATIILGRARAGGDGHRAVEVAGRGSGGDASAGAAARC